MSIANSDHYPVPTLDFYFLSEFLQSKQENYAASSHFYYLDRKNVAILVAGRDPPSTPISESMQGVARPPLTFMMVEHRQMLFFMLLNLQRHEALLISIGVNHEQNIAEQAWFQAIWKGVVKLLGWSERHSNYPTILYSSWIAVCLLFLTEMNSCHARFDRNMRILPLVAFLSSTPFSPNSGNGPGTVVAKLYRRRFSAALKYLTTSFLRRSRDARSMATTGSNLTNITKLGH
jgi:hypothetical protein